MKYRDYTKGSAKISEIGFGAWQIGDRHQLGEMTEDEALIIVDKAIEAGCNFFDTAPNYGLGNSEILLGKALKKKRNKVVINTKCGHNADGNRKWDSNELLKSVEDSLVRLQTDYVDSLILHNPPKEMLYGDSEQMKILIRLKDEGMIKAYGASVDFSDEMEILLNHSDSEVIEVMFNVFHQEPLVAFQKAQNKGVALIIKVPLDSGWLSGKYNQNSIFTDVRSRWSPEILKRRTETLENIQFLKTNQRSMVQAALAFILKQDAVSTIIPGIKSIAQLTENYSANAEMLSANDVNSLHEIYNKNLKADLLPW